MNTLATTTISPIDLINFSQGIAQLNLGYLGISVAILGVLGGVFVYFNIKPLKETLEKQERAIEELKKEAQGLLVMSAEQSEKALENFKVNQSKLLTVSFEQQEEKLGLEMTNKIQEIDKVLSDKIENISESKDLKLREIILSETNNRLAILGKELTSKITAIKEDIAKEASQNKSVIVGLKAAIKELNEEVKELQVYKYSKEGKMGAIIISIDLLEKAIDEYLENKKMFSQSTSDEKFKETFGWKTEKRLKELIKEIGDYKLEQNYISQINKQLVRIKGELAFSVLISQLKEKIKI